MQNLIYLVIMALAGAGGWYAGSWKGRDAVDALARIEQSTGQAKAALVQSEAKLVADLAAQKAKFDADRSQLDEAHAKQTQSLQATIASNSQDVAKLQKTSQGRLADIARLTRERDAAKTPDDKKKLDTQLAAVVAEQKTVQVEIDGRQCLPVPVPLVVLADWRGAAP